MTAAALLTFTLSATMLLASEWKPAPLTTGQRADSARWDYIEHSVPDTIIVYDWTSDYRVVVRVMRIPVCFEQPDTLARFVFHKYDLDNGRAFKALEKVAPGIRGIWSPAGERILKNQRRCR